MGILMDMTITYNGSEYSLKEFSEDFDMITSIDYNIVSFRKDCVCDLIKETIDDQYESLYVDGVKIGYPYEITRVNGTSNKFKFVVPNDSVMRKAQNLLTALNGHRNIDRFTGKRDFDIEDHLDLSIEDQLMVILEYLRSRIKLGHFIHYELMVYAMTRDADNKSQRVTSDTQKIMFMHSKDILYFPDRNHSMASTLPYGYISKAFRCLYKNTQPDEYDLLMVNLLNKEPNTDTVYREMNLTLGKAIKENDDYFGNDNIIGDDV